MVIEKHLGQGKFEPVGEADVEVPAGGNPVPPAFEALDVTECAVYRAYPEGFGHSPGFYRLNPDATLDISKTRPCRASRIGRNARTRR